MAVTVSALQARHDTRLRAELSAASDVTTALRTVQDNRSGYGFGFRHSLLASALRLTRGMSPEVAAALDGCREVLGVTEPIEVYVTREEGINAFATRSVAGPLIIGLSSHLIESFTPPELRFVVGHELGHAVFDHFKFPMPAIGRVEDLAGRIVTRPTLLKLFLWSRSAEISADRAGLVCSRDAEAASRAFFKIATGIASSKIHFDAAAFASQAEALASTPLAFRDGREEDYHLNCFSTHPYSPLRVRALLAYATSQPYLSAIGSSQAPQLDLEALEAYVDKDLERMEPTYLEEKTARGNLMRKLLFHAGYCVAFADGTVDPREEEALRLLLGKDLALEPKSLEEARKLFDADCAQAIQEVPLSFRVQVVQHLTVVASADGEVRASELEQMHRVAGALGVEAFVVDTTLKTAASPLD